MTVRGVKTILGGMCTCTMSPAVLRGLLLELRCTSGRLMKQCIPKFLHFLLEVRHIVANAAVGVVAAAA